MPVKVITTEAGHSLAPEGPHTVTFHFPGWDSIHAFRAGDPKVFATLRSIYPRFGPFFLARELTDAIHKALSLPPTHGVLAFADPHAFALAQTYGLSSHRKEFKLGPTELTFRVLDIASIRLYAVVYPLSKTKGIIGIWQNPGFGFSTRLSEYLLRHLDTVSNLPFEATAADDVSIAKLPPTAGLPESDAHSAVRERIVGLLKRAPLGGREYAVSAGDVVLAPTGMAAIYQFTRAALDTRKGSVVGLGSLFHSSWHVFEDAPYGYKHFGDVGQGLLEKLDKYVAEEQAAGRGIAFLFLEFPSNPILESADLKGLRLLADKYEFPLVVDETIGSFCNIDVLPVADVIITSLTKSFSGYANVMGGSMVFNPSSPYYAPLKTAADNLHVNALYAGDAAVLLSNSNDYLARSAILNRNGAALAAFLQSQALLPSSPVAAVRYPPYNKNLDNYRAFMREPTPDFPNPGYGCLLSIDFESEAMARAFYEAVQFHHGPHLGAHETLVLNFNVVAWGDSEELAAYQAEFGASQDQVRISVGLEDVDVLIDTTRAALDAAEAARVPRPRDGLQDL